MKARMMVETKLIMIKVTHWQSMDDLRRVYKYSLGEPREPFGLRCLLGSGDDTSLLVRVLQNELGLPRFEKVFAFFTIDAAVRRRQQICIYIAWTLEDQYSKYMVLSSLLSFECGGGCSLRASLWRCSIAQFGVEDYMVEPFLEGMNLVEAMQRNRIFMTDIAIVEGVPLMTKETLWGSMALFFLNKRNDLMPIAIQLRQQKGVDNPVFLPSDPPFTWIAAKMYYNNSDASYHQSCSHLGFTHLLMEGVTVCTHRNLSPSHPLFKLMAPHFLFLIAINSRGISKLVSPGGWVDKTLAVGVKGMFEIIRRGLEVWRLDQHGNPEKDIESRGVRSRLTALRLPTYFFFNPSYPFPHVAPLGVVNYYYDTPEKLKNDYELQQWRDELVKERHLTGVGLKASDEHGQFTDVEQVIDTVTAIIQQCSVGHAAANFQQYEEYAFPPNYPAFLYNGPPTDKTSVRFFDDLQNRHGSGFLSPLCSTAADDKALRPPRRDISAAF
ncbi:hypothetical protein HPB51_012966 [Rhipicephalus microplus]|uniref:Lipoxygenase domain-containing protein n=1 Tax=Rhipicephalus microplus TaxID=6941 RepID=A0A9J6F2S4_RHIMP|nr:hypothetical protein HPB51_012966 [Rhipicephalus microplus]